MLFLMTLCWCVIGWLVLMQLCWTCAGKYYMIIDINVSDNLYSFLIYLKLVSVVTKQHIKLINAQVIQLVFFYISFLNDFQLIFNVCKHKSETILEKFSYSPWLFKYLCVTSLCLFIDVWFHANSIHVGAMDCKIFTYRVHTAECNAVFNVFKHNLCFTIFFSLFKSLLLLTLSHIEFNSICCPF